MIYFEKIFGNPFIQMEECLNKMEGVFDNFFGSDILEKSDYYLVNLETPGISKNDLSITISSNILTVKQATKDNNGTWQADLGNNIDIDKITSIYQDGLLTIKLPKKTKDKSKAKTIKIE